MSTKIYTGFIVRGASTFEGLTLLGKERPVIQELVDTKNHKIIIEKLTNYLDRFYTERALRGEVPVAFKESMSDSAWWSCSQELFKEQTECRAGNTRSPLIDCDVELTLHLDPESGNLLGYLQEERVGVHAHLVSTPSIQDYGFWNNSDKPEEVSEEDWETRSRDWNRVLDTDTVAKFSMRWIPSFIDPRELKQPFPSLESRAQKRAKDCLVSKALETVPRPAPPNYSFSKIMGELRKAETAIADPTTALHAEYLALTERLKGVLLPSLQEHLFTSLKDLPSSAA